MFKRQFISAILILVGSLPLLAQTEQYGTPVTIDIAKKAAAAAIAEVRNFYEAKMAEQQVLYQSALRTTADPEARATLEQQYRRDRERFTSERDSKIEKIRRDG